MNHSELIAAGTDSGNLPHGEAHRTFGFGLTQDSVQKLQDILRRECGVELTLEQAWARATELLALFRMLLGPLPEERNENVEAVVRTS